MAAIVKANSFLTAGGLAVLKRSFDSREDGSVNYRADYCCLARFANNHIGKFRKGSTPPTAIPVEMLRLSLRRPPALYDLQFSTENGLSYFSAQYITENIDTSEAEREITVSRSEDQRTAAGFITVTVTTPAPTSLSGPNYIRSTSQQWVSCDYLAVTVTTTSRNAGAGGASGSVGRIFNRRGFPSSGTIAGLARSTINSTSSTRSSRGDVTFTFTSTGILSIG